MSFGGDRSPGIPLQKKLKARRVAPSLPAAHEQMGLTLLLPSVFLPLAFP